MIPQLGARGRFFYKAGLTDSDSILPIFSRQSTFGIFSFQFLLKSHPLQNYFFKYNFISFWLCWVFVAAQAFSSCSKHAQSLQSCLTLCNHKNYSPPAPLSMGFPRQEYWSGLPFPSPEDLSDPGIEPVSPALQADFFFFFLGKKWIYLERNTLHRQGVGHPSQRASVALGETSTECGLLQQLSPATRLLSLCSGA